MTGRERRRRWPRCKADRDFIGRLRAAKTRLETGFVAIDPASGEIRAWVGSRDFQRDQFDHVAQAARQPGSTFKPIVYGAALEKGFSPERTYQDAPLKIVAADGSVWQPTDMSGSTGGPMSLRQGLIHSKNTITAQVGQEVGLPAIISLARALGVNQSKLEAVPSLVLGTSPVTLLEMVSAYASIADSGQYRQPVFIRSITDRKGRVLAQFSQRAEARDERAGGGRTDRHHARRGQPGHRQRGARALRPRGRSGRQDRHHAKQYRRLVHPDASEPGGRLLGRLQRCARHDAQQLLGPGRA